MAAKNRHLCVTMGIKESLEAPEIFSGYTREPLDALEFEQVKGEANLQEAQDLKASSPQETDEFYDEK